MVTAELHIEPADDPESGIPTDFRITYTEAPDNFKTTNCDCYVSIIRYGKQIARHRLPATYPWQSRDQYVFPKGGVYQLRINGRPKQAAAYTSFELTYDIRVRQGPAASRPRWQTISFVGGLVVLVGLALWSAHRLLRTPSTQKKHKEKHRHA